VIANLLNTAQNVAHARQPALWTAWVNLSFRLGCAIPGFALSITIQKDGDVDLILRCLEDDMAALIQKSQGSPPATDIGFYRTLIRYWIGSMYETFRILKNARPADQRIKRIHDELALIRMPLEKLEIASDHKLSAPLKLKRFPPNGDASDEVVYDKSNKYKSHIMPEEYCSYCGSVIWTAIDGKTSRERQITRRAISDQILALGAPVTSEQPEAAISA
jgi:hypothetical protein